MLSNRSIPQCTVIPELDYANIGEAIDWLCDVFGFTLRLRIGDHRAQLNVGDGAIVLTTRRAAPGSPAPSQSVLVRVEDANRHHARATERGALVFGAPTDYPYGERQYTAQDPGGHYWTFSQSIADVHPSDWGGTPGLL